MIMETQEKTLQNSKQNGHDDAAVYFCVNIQKGKKKHVQETA